MKVREIKMTFNQAPVCLYHTRQLKSEDISMRKSNKLAA